MRIAADYLNVKPPFAIQHAERAIPYSTSDEILQFALSALDVFRATFELPWTFLMLFLIFLLRGVDEILGAALVFEVPKQLEKEYRVRESVREVRGYFEKSAGEVAVRERKKLA